MITGSSCLSVGANCVSNGVLMIRASNLNCSAEYAVLTVEGVPTVPGVPAVPAVPIVPLHYWNTNTVKPVAPAPAVNPIFKI